MTHKRSTNALAVRPRTGWATLVSIVLAVAAACLVALSPAPAYGDAVEVSATVTDFNITTTSGTVPGQGDAITTDTNFRFNVNWKLTDQSQAVHTGDWFTITLPDTMKFPAAANSGTFNIYDPDDPTKVMAIGEVHTGDNETGGYVKVTFTDGANERTDMHGTVSMTARLRVTDKNVITDQGVTVQIDGKTFTDTNHVPFIPPEVKGDEILNKYIATTSDGEAKILWSLRINFSGNRYASATVTDSITTDEQQDAGKVTYEPTSFRLYTGTYNADGSVDYTKPITEIDISSRLTVASDNRSFSLDMGGLLSDGAQYMLQYQTSNSDKVSFSNHAHLTAGRDSSEKDYHWQSSDASGTTQGKDPYKFSILKRDASTRTGLAGATFELRDANGNVVKDVNGDEVRLTTGSDGRVTSQKMRQGTYYLVETAAPTGYQLDQTPQTVTISPDDTVTKTYTFDDSSQTTQISVTKAWDDANNQDGIRPDSVTVQLYADGVAVAGKTLTLSADGGWTGSFTDLPLMVSGQQVTYTVQEVAVPTGYQASYSTDGLTVTNTHTPETVDVPVAKSWDDHDDRDGIRPASVTVQLYADGQAVEGKTLALSADGNWTGTFTGLPKYKDGQQIAYTVKEADVPEGYTATVTGTAQDGFTITNTHVPSVALPATGDTGLGVTALGGMALCLASLALMARRRLD